MTSVRFAETMMKFACMYFWGSLSIFGQKIIISKTTCANDLEFDMHVPRDDLNQFSSNHGEIGIFPNILANFGCFGSKYIF